MINKTDLAPAIGADLRLMERDSLRMRDGGPFVFSQVHCVEPFISSNVYVNYYASVKSSSCIVIAFLGVFNEKGNFIIYT